MKMSLKFYEALKSILRDVESFLSYSLKDVKLPKAVAAERDEIAKKINDLEEEFPQLKSEVSKTDSKPEPSPHATSPKQIEFRPRPSILAPNERSQKVESEIYDDIVGIQDAECDSIKSPSSCGSSKKDSIEYSNSVKKESSDYFTAARKESTGPDASNSGTNLSAMDALSSSSIHGYLIRGDPGAKSKVDIKKLVGGLFGGKKLYCVVSGGVFLIYDKGNSKKHSTSFPLRGYEARMSADQSVKFGKSKDGFSFEIVSPGHKSYMFAAESQEEMEKWIAVLNAESQKLPDPRTSALIENNDSIESDSEDSASRMSSSSSAQVPKKKSASTTVLDGSGDNEDFYDDVPGAGHDASGLDEDFYEDAASPVREADDDMIYEEFPNSGPPLPSHPLPPQPMLPPIRGQPQRPLPAVVTKPAVAAPPVTVKAPPPKTSSGGGKMGDNDYENTFYGKWDCQADADNELAFKRGDVILILSREYDNFGWWVGKLNGSVGLVPREYMTPAYELVSS